MFLNICVDKEHPSGKRQHLVVFTYGPPHILNKYKPENMCAYIPISLSNSIFRFSLLRPRKRPIRDPENRYAYIITTISASVLDFSSTDTLLTQSQKGAIFGYG